MSTAGALSLLRAALPQLSAAGRQVAERVLAGPAGVLSWSMAQLAAEVGVSDTTVLRMCQTAGFAGYTDFKLQLAADLAAQRAVDREGGAGFAVTDESTGVLAALAQDSVQAILDTVAVADQKVLDRAVDRLVAARRVLIVGSGGSAQVGEAAAYRLSRAGVLAEFPRDPVLVAARLAVLGTEDVVVAISHSGATLEVVQALDTAVAQGCECIAVTADPTAAVARRCQDVIRVVGRDVPPDAWAGRIAQLVVVDALARTCAQRGPAAAAAAELGVRAVVGPRSI